MSPRFRPAYLILDPFTGERGLLGFVVEGAAVGFVPAQTSWPTAQSTLLASVVVEQLEALTTFEQPPMGAGPQVVFGEPVQLPHSAQEPTMWVKTHLLDRAHAA